MTNRNPLASQSINDKKAQYLRDIKENTFAYKSDETKVPLKKLRIQDVEFIGGLWRVQDKASYKAIQIRDKKMVLGPRIDHTENTHFEYYKVALLSYNCYGPMTPHFMYVAAKYSTDKGTYWSYGKSIAEARAFLGVALFDDYKELIHNEACKNTLQNAGK